MTPPVKKIKNETNTDAQLENAEWPLKFPGRKFLEGMAPFFVHKTSSSKTINLRQEQILSTFSKSFGSVKSSSLRWAFWSVGLGFISLMVLPFINPYLTLVSVSIMFAGTVTGLASSFTSSGKALTSIRKASRHFAKGNPEKALEFLEKAYTHQPTYGIKEDIDQLKVQLQKSKKNNLTRN